ncbi:HemE: putative uroporphyrinogen decarboxylase [Desulfosarcina variabilis str. Montpellier]|uniref:uroporphyrinogen decarboxylase family protein n=1 Tax=Desulfosarcina variabilis TaxID=2300 RepID=UPI003AFA0BA4
MEKSKQELLVERKKRIADVIALKVPDRVPIWFQDAGFFPAKYAGITSRDAMYDGDKLFAAYKKTFIDFKPDFFFNPGHAIHTPGDALETLDCKQVVLPGQKNLPITQSFQFVEGEYLKGDEYDMFLDDPTWFTISRYLPRVHGALAPLGNLPPITALLLGYYGVPVTAGMVSDEIITAMEKFCQAARSVQAHAGRAAQFIADMEEEGFPLSCGAITLAPFDFIGDTMRGLREILMDMFRRPDKLLAAVDKVTQLTIDLAIGQCQTTGNPGVFIPLHKGSDGFLSDEQFKRFFWPSLKKLLLALIDTGLTPYPFFEGIHDSRLEYYTELPKGKVVGLFDRTDYRKAKEVLGQTMCMSGFMPLSLLQTGTVDDVKAYAKDLIDVVGKDGGFIMAPRGMVDETKPELIKAWFDFTKEYGRYI